MLANDERLINSLTTKEIEMDTTLAKVIGMEAVSGRITLEETGYIVRIKKPGEMSTMDYRDDRVSITIEAGKIVKAEIG